MERGSDWQQGDKAISRFQANGIRTKASLGLEIQNLEIFCQLLLRNISHRLLSAILFSQQYRRLSPVVLAPSVSCSAEVNPHIIGRLLSAEPSRPFLRLHLLMLHAAYPTHPSPVTPGSLIFHLGVVDVILGFDAACGVVQ